MSKPSTLTTHSDREIVVSRVVSHPRDVVFEAFTTPEQTPIWWGPRGFTTTVLEMDIRVGGKWRYIMHGPDGTDYPNVIIYTDITPSERLAYDHGETEEKMLFKSVITFQEAAGGTLVTLRAIFPTAEAAAAVRGYAEPGGASSLECLAEFLDQNAA